MIPLNPSIDQVIKLFSSYESFTMIRLTCEFWKMVNNGLIRMGKQFQTTDSFIDELAVHMVKSWEEGLGGRRSKIWKITPFVYSDILKFCLKRPLPDNIRIGLGTKAMISPMVETPNLPLNLDSSNVMSQIVPLNIGYHSTIWRRYACTGDINHLFKIKNCQFIIVGPPVFKDFGKKANLKHFHHIQIDENNAILHVKKTKEKILESYNKFNNFDKIIYLGCGGPAVIWPFINFHGLKNVVMLDVGVSLFAYYFNPNVSLARWLDIYPPLWLKKNYSHKTSHEWIRWNKNR